MQIVKSMFRHYVAPEQLDTAVAFYEELQQLKCERRLSFSEARINVAVVGSFILVAGDDSALAPVRQIQAAFVVDSLDAFSAWLRAQGAEVSAVHESDVGRNVMVRHQDGFCAEYFQPAAA
jgi:predicted enzyme related to lactoylglutathione lyase